MIGKDAVFPKITPRINQTYALRLTFHEDERLYQTGNREYLFAIRIIGIDNDGGYLFAWKNISERKIPKLENPGKQSAVAPLRSGN